MAAAPQLTLITPQPNVPFTPALFLTLQQNIQSFGMLYMPLSGGTFSGPVQFSVGQQMASSGVNIIDPSYPHTGVHQVLNDHLNDPAIHAIPGPPLAHASSHAVSGTDPVYGDQAGISSGIPGTTIKGYIDTQIASVSQSLINPAPASSYYEIGGADPLYGNLISINAASGSIDIKTYVDTSLSNALAGTFPQNPSFQSVTIATGGLLFSGAVGITASGNYIITTDPVNLNVIAPTSGGNITLGGLGGSANYGSFGPSGYTVGSTNIGPLGGGINGPTTIGGDLSVNRSSIGSAGQGQLDFGLTSANAHLSWNADAGSLFYLSQGLQVAGPLSLLASNALSIDGEFTIGVVKANSLTPGIRTDGTNAYFYALDSGSLYFGYDNVTLSSLSFGPTGTWGSLDVNGLHIGSTTINATNSAIIGSLTVGGATITNSGDLGVARTTNTGLMSFGHGTATFDFGVTNGGYFTFSVSGSGSSQIRNDGAYLAGASLYGPGGATVGGAITSTRSIAASTGTVNGGFTFNGATNTGLFAQAATSLSLIVSGTTVFTSTPAATTYFEPIIATSGVSASTLTASGNANVNGNLILAGSMQAGNSTITRFRVKTGLYLGYIAGTIALTGANSVFPNVVVIGYTSPQLEAIRISSLTPDASGTATTINILQNGNVIGTISLPNGGNVALSYPITNPTILNPGDLLQAVVTAAGTATGVYVALELSEFIS